MFYWVYFPSECGSPPIKNPSVCKVPYHTVKSQSEILTGMFHEFEAEWKRTDKFIST